MLNLSTFQLQDHYGGVALMINSQRVVVVRPVPQWDHRLWIYRWTSYNLRTVLPQADSTARIVQE